jgi:hypothetical protein
MVSTFKYTGTDPFEIPSLSVRVGAGETFTVPDEFDARFDADPVFESSSRKRPDVVPDPAVVAAATGPVPVQSSEPAPAA